MYPDSKQLSDGELRSRISNAIGRHYGTVPSDVALSAIDGNRCRLRCLLRVRMPDLHRAFLSKCCSKTRRSVWRSMVSSHGIEPITGTAP